MIRLIIISCLTTVLAAGCGGASSAPSERHLPGIKEFGLNEAQFVRHVEKTEATIAQCMADAGFEYVPVDVKTVERAQLYVRADPQVSREDYHKRWGYGETTRFDDPVRTIGLGSENQRIYGALPPAGQSAYNRTLFGANPKKSFAWTLDEEDFSETGGCTRKGAASAFTKKQMLGTFVNPKDVLVDSDPRIVKAVDKWERCMRDKGYVGYRDQDEIMEELGDRLDELLNGDDPRSLTGHRAQALKHLQEQEVAASLADLGCEKKYTDDLYRQVEIEVFGQPVSG